MSSQKHRTSEEDSVVVLDGGEAAPKSALASTPSSVVQDFDEGKSLYDRKCLLINAELDRHGMGRYQWYIFFLCGFGYLLDLLWAQAFGLVLQPLMQEMGFPGELFRMVSIGFSKSSGLY